MASPWLSRDGDLADVPYGLLHGPPEQTRWARRLLLPFAVAAVLLASLGAALVGLRATRESSPPATVAMPGHVPLVSRGRDAGVSEKTSGVTERTMLHAGYGVTEAFPWSNAMLQWQRSAFHFQPEKNWMNDPNAPVYYKGWYHLFYQYNPTGAVWGNITWGHAVSRDLVNWLHLPLAMLPDRWYDANGVFTGSATILPGDGGGEGDGRPVILYTGSTNTSAQVQCLAVPANDDDELLLSWSKSDANPVLLPPPGVGSTDFRDPATAIFHPLDSSWRVAIGTRDNAGAGVAIVYSTKDFLSYDLLPGALHAVDGTGMWECVDLYPVSTDGAAGGLHTSEAAGEGVRHVLKASLDDDRHDYYAIGRYDASAGKWTPDDEEADVGVGLRYDWGKFYASKTFYDPAKRRRVLWGWVGETDSESADVQKGWASLQSIPRTVLYDSKTQSNLLQWPVEEIQALRSSVDSFDNTVIDSGAVVQLHVPSATQLDIEAEFEVEASALANDVGYNCSTSGGSGGRGVLGPFGILVLADSGRSEQTAVYFYVARDISGGVTTHFCHDETRSSKARDIVKRVVGAAVPVLGGEALAVRVLVDHSIVESFALGGRACVTSRVYPTRAINKAAGVYLFNNATGARVVAKSVKVWQMNAATIQPYRFDT